MKKRTFLRAGPGSHLPLLTALLFIPLSSLFAQEGEETLYVTGEKILEKAPLSTFSTTIDTEELPPAFQTLPEVLSEGAGINVLDFAGLGKLSTISIRGASSEQVLVLVDGIRLNPVQGGGVDLSTIPLPLIERVEVTRGGGSALYGTDAIGGTLNIITHTPKERPQFNYGQSFGSFGTGEVAAGISGTRERFDSLAFFSLLSTKGDFEFMNDNGTQYNDQDDFFDIRDNNDSITGGFLLNSGFRPSGMTEFRLISLTTFDEKGIPGIVLFPTRETRQSDFRESISLRFKGRRLPLVWADLETTAYYYHERLDYSGAPEYFYPESHQRTSAGGLRFEEHMSPFKDHRFDILLESIQESFLDQEAGRFERARFSAGAIYEMSPLSGLLVSLFALRGDLVTGRDSETTSALSPRGGAKVRVFDRLYMKVNLGRDFRLPSLTDLYLETGFIEGNPDLLPERGLSGDGGLLLIGDGLRFESALFYSKVENLIQYEQVSGWRYRPRNVGSAEISGIEIDLTLDPFEWLDLAENYTFTRAIELSDDVNQRGKQLVGRPVHKLNSSMRFSYKDLSLCGEFQFTDGNFVTPANTVELPERYLVNFSISSGSREGMEFSFEIKNLLDEMIMDIYGFPLPGRSFFFKFRFNV